MARIKPAFARLFTLGLLLTACAPAGEAASTSSPVESAEDPIYLSIIWHQHQPVYYKDPQTDLYVRPWVRVHASKDYVDMAAILEDYPEIHATFNLTPSLIRQLDDLGSGAKDLYWHLSEIPADELSEEDKAFILERFFDTNREIIGRFPRYQELLTLRDRGGVYSEQDFRDLQLLFNLAWTDPEWLAQEPLASLVAKSEGFSEEDKAIVFVEHLRLIQEVIPLHKRMQDAGQIEVTMTPFAHPILPLLVTTQLAREALPELEMPSEPFIYGQDATAQLDLGFKFYEDHFGRAPRGMWPAEGSVAQEIVTMVSQAGLQWIASDEGVLANSLGFEGFERSLGDLVLEADTLYRPYYVQGQRGEPVAIVFRDVVISDKVGFTYSGTPGAVAASDFIGRVHDIRQELIDSGAEGPHLVTVLLDGENAWEFYENDGKEFLHSLYSQLSEDSLIKTVTPSEFLAIAPEQPAIEDLWAGSWINHDFSTWIGEEEENSAWELLSQTRAFLQTFITGENKDLVTQEQLDAALEAMYIAEGSDWFWWYGADQNSGNDEIFDQQFRSTLADVYAALGVQPPLSLAVPIIPEAPAIADAASQGLLIVNLDGMLSEDEWAQGGAYLASGGAMASADMPLSALRYGFDAQNLYLGIALADGVATSNAALDLYFSIPGSGEAAGASMGGSVLGFPGEARVLVDLATGSASLATSGGMNAWNDMDAIDAAVGGDAVELAIPLALLGNADIGAPITLRAYYTQISEINGVASTLDAGQLPSDGPAQLIVPDLGNTQVVLDVTDPEGDDHGPGTYTYPQDVVFNAGNFDILNFQVGSDDENIVFKFTVRGPVDNAWASPNGLALQTFDIYIDKDHDGQGGVALFPGRNLALADGFAWDLAIHAEGWTSGIYEPSAEDGITQIATSSEFQVLADPDQRKVTIRVPKAILGDDPAAWAYAAMVMSQEGYPSGGVMRVRDVLPVAEQWRIGGALDGTNTTRVLDLVWPEAGVQETWLSAFTVSRAPQTELTAQDFATIEMFTAGE